MADETVKLNKEQLRAIKHGDGPLLIIAGAGTGKTTVVTERIKFLISSGKTKPSEILALTFTDKAAREMEERVDIIMPYGYTQMWVSTFHAFCDRILRQEALHIGLDPRYNLLTQAETIQLLRQNLFKFELDYFRPLGNPTKFIDGMLQHFSRLKDEDISPEEYLRYAKELNKETSEEKEKILELAKAYKVYEELKVKESKMDFANLISQVLRLFRTRQGVLRRYKDQFRYILVDEFQDTNYAQYALLKILAPPANVPNLTVVGDDSQSIYKFRGAAISNILQFMEEYKEAKQVVLTKNYRSSQTILDHAYRLIKFNDPDTLEVKLGISKNLKKMREVEEKPVELIYADRVEEEADKVVRIIKELCSGQTGETYDFKDAAILIRANNHAEAFLRALARAGIPYQFLGPGMLFRQPEVKDLIAYLKVLSDFEDSVAMYRVLAMDIFNILPRDLAAITNYSKHQKISIFEACEQIAKIFVSQQTKKTIEKFIKIIHRHMGLIKKETAGQILYYFLEDTGILQKLTKYTNPGEERQAQNISKLFDKLKTYEVEHEDASVFAVSDWIDLSLELGESPLAADFDWTEINAVNILTVHSSKGLEFPIVFLVNLVARRFPTAERREQIPIPEALIKEILPVGDYHLEEERRLFYVGMTRARDRLFLTAANYYGEGKRERKISPFVVETLGESIIKKPMTKEKKDSQLSLFDWTKPAIEEDKSLPKQRKVTYLSFSQIDTFRTCPLQYRYRFLQKIPIPSSAAQSFGDSIHKTLRDFYQQIKEKREQSLKDLLDLLGKNWSNTGYISKAHEQKMRVKGEEMLKKFYGKIDLEVIPEDLEQPFVIKISPELKLGGKIDRVDKKNDKLKIIDYKTGKVLSQEEIDKSLQMTIYALAAIDKGVYGKNARDVVLTFYFLEEAEEKLTTRTSEQLEAAKQEIIKKAEEIEKSSFEPIPGPWCDFCDFKLICEAWL